MASGEFPEIFLELMSPQGSVDSSAKDRVTVQQGGFHPGDWVGWVKGTEVGEKEGERA